MQALQRAFDERLDHLSRALSRLRADQTALTPGAKSLLDRLRVDVDGFPKLVEAAIESDFDESQASRDQWAARQLGVFIKQMYAVAEHLLPVLENARGERIPVDLNEVLMTGARKSDPTVEQVVLYSHSQFNYVVTSLKLNTSLFGLAGRLDGLARSGLDAERDLAGPSAQEEDNAPNVNAKFLLFGVPSVFARSHVLHGVVLGHELGHVRNWRHGTARTFLARYEAAVAAPNTADANTGEVIFTAPSHGPDSVALVARWLAEMVSDTYAVLTIGPAAIFSLLEMVPGSLTTDSITHPSAARRVAHMLQVLDSRLEFAAVTDRFLRTHLDALTSEFQQYVGLPPALQARATSDERAWEWLRSELAAIGDACAFHVGDEDLFTPERWKAVRFASHSFQRGLPAGEHWPPTEGAPKDNSERVLVNAGWRTKMSGIADIQGLLGPGATTQEASRVLDGLLLKSFEIIRFRQKSNGADVGMPERQSASKQTSGHGRVKQAMLVVAGKAHTGRHGEPITSSTRPASVSRSEVLSRLLDPNDLYVSPFPSDQAIGKGAIDLRIGTFFLAAKRSAGPAIDGRGKIHLSTMFQEIYVPPGEPLIIHPGQLILSATLEYIALPLDLAGMIHSRSSWGRMGLVSATASWVGPGYKGCPTLEIVNVGDLPVELYPYTALCHMVLFSAREDDTRSSRYQCNVRPQYLRSYDDPQVEMWITKP